MRWFSPSTNWTRSIGTTTSRSSSAAPSSYSITSATTLPATSPSTSSTDRHYAVFLHGDTPLTAHLITPVLVDGASGAMAGLREMP